MGIKRLTTYVNSDEMASAWHGGVVLRDTRLVIDGGGLLYRLLEVHGPSGQEGDVRCGGQYCDFYHFACTFFNDLKQHGVRPLVVLDGVGVDQKLDTARERGEQQALFLRKLSECVLDQHEISLDRTVLPVWTTLVFVEAAVDCGVPMVRVEREADDVIAAVAHHYKCPVLTGDSDFFICDLPGGVIHLRKINYRQPCSAPVPLFRRCSFIGALAKLHSLRGCTEEQIRDVLPLAATLCGNDYVAQGHVQKLYTSSGGGGGGAGSHALVQALRWLLTVLRVRTLGDGVAELHDAVPGTVHEMIKYSVGTYAQSASQCSEIVMRYLSPERLSMSQSQNETAEEASASKVGSLPTYPGGMMEAFHLGFIHPVALSGRLCDLYKVDVHLDSPQHAPISNLDAPLRSVLLTFLSSSGAASVKELVRCPGGTSMQTVRLHAVQQVPGYGAVPSLQQVALLSLEQRRRFLLLACESWTDRVKALPPLFQFFAASLRYLWTQMLANSHNMPAISPRHIAVLLVGFVDGCEGNCKSPLLDVDRALESQKKLLESWCGVAAPGHHPGRSEAARGDVAPLCPTPCYVGQVACQAIHVFNGWQRVVLLLVQINWALGLPMPPVRLHRLYDGVRNYTLHEDVRIKDVLSATPHRQLAQTLWMAVSDGLEDWQVGTSAGRSKKRRRQKQQNRKGAQDSASAQTASAVNRFAGLNLE